MLDTQLSRRGLLAGASAGTAAGVLGGRIEVDAKAPMLNTQAPSFYRFKIGSIEATVVSDGPLPIGPATRTFRGPTEAELDKMFGEYFLPTDNVVLDQNALVINTGERLVLFDTGMASAKRPNTQTGRLLISLKQAGIDPKDIDAVVLTHPHIDHSGGMVADDGSRIFPNAQVYLTQADLDFWLDDARLGHPGRRLRHDRAQESAALSRPHGLHQGRPGNPAGRAGDAHAGTHGRSHGVPDHVRRQDDLQHRRRRASPDPVRASPRSRSISTPIQSKARSRA